MAKFRVELRSTAFNVIDILDNEYLDLSWSYSRMGGCGEFSFRLPRKLAEQKSLTGEQNVRIYYRDPTAGTYSLWYQGLIENKIPNVKGNSEDIEVSGHGYQTQLSRIYIEATYSSQEISVIVKSILDTYITPNTNITYSIGDLESTGITLGSIQFNDYADTVFQKLSDIAGTREYGVDKTRSFFFKARSSTVGLIYPLGKNITDFNENLDFKQIINRITVQGAQVGGTYFTFGPYSDAQSQVKYNRRDKVIQNSSITTEAVASQFADATLDEFNEAVRRSNFDLIGLEAQLEATNPVPLLNIVRKQVRYGQKKYGTFLYAGSVNRVVNRINYSLTNNGTLKISVDVGTIRPAVAEKLS